MTVSRALAQEAAGFSINLKDPTGVDLRMSRVIDPSMPLPVSGSDSITVGIREDAIRPREDLQKIEKSVNGITYSGTVKDGLRHGHGKQTWPDGSYYQG